MPVQITIASKTLNQKERIKILGNKKLNHFYLQTKLYTMHLKKNFNGNRFNAPKRTPGTNNPRPENQKRGKPKVLQQIMETKKHCLWITLNINGLSYPIRSTYYKIR